MKLILHIGTDKTGSTAIQTHLYVNRQWLLARGVYVPLTGLGKDNGHQKLLKMMDQEQMSCMADELAAAQSEGFSSAIISWEGMRFFGVAEIRRLLGMLHSDDLWVLVYLREQADIIQTGYLQKLKKDRSKIRIADFQRGFWTRSRLAALLYCYSPMWNYARLIRKWTRFISDGHVLVREFSKDLLVNRSVVDDLLSVLDQFPDDEFIRIKNTANISLDVESAIIMNEDDKLGSIEQQRRIKIYSLQSLINSEGYGTRFFLSANRVKSIRRFYRKSNKSIGGVVKSPIPEPFSSPPNCVRNYSEESILRSVEERRSKFSALMGIPMLFVTSFPHKTPSVDLLTSGWCKPHDWGAWSSGDVSNIRFRVPFWMSNHGNAKLFIFLKGRYCGKNTRSRVSVNEVNFGWIDLRTFPQSISIPISALHTNEVVEIQLLHEFPERPSEKDLTSHDGLISFGMEKLGFQFSNPE